MNYLICYQGLTVVNSSGMLPHGKFRRNNNTIQKQPKTRCNKAAKQFFNHPCHIKFFSKKHKTKAFCDRCHGCHRSTETAAVECYACTLVFETDGLVIVVWKITYISWFSINHNYCTTLIYNDGAHPHSSLIEVLHKRYGHTLRRSPRSVHFLHEPLVADPGKPLIVSVFFNRVLMNSNTVCCFYRQHWNQGLLFCFMMWPHCRRHWKWCQVPNQTGSLTLLWRHVPWETMSMELCLMCSVSWMPVVMSYFFCLSLFLLLLGRYLVLCFLIF